MRIADEYRVKTVLILSHEELIEAEYAVLDTISLNLQPAKASSSRPEPVNFQHSRIHDYDP